MSWFEVPQNEIVGNLNLTMLGMDEAYLTYTSDVQDTDLYLFELDRNCYKCPYKVVSQIMKDGNDPKPIHTATRFRIRTNGSEFAPEENDIFRFCDLDHRFGEFGVYEWRANGNLSFPQCEFTVVAEPVNIYYPLILATIFYAVLLTLCYIVGGYVVKWLNRSNSSTSNGNVNEAFRPSPSPTTSRQNENGNASPRSEGSTETGNLVKSASQDQIRAQSQTGASPPKPKPRLRSLDTFRGIAIVVMIFVNGGGGKYFFFEHAPWDGLYVADLVFPWFLWIMGVCIPIAIKSQVKKGTPKLDIFITIAFRSFKLAGLGLMLGTVFGTPIFGDGANLRITGVLQRFGVCYFVCATLVLFSMSVNIVKPEGNKVKAAVQDIGVLWISWIVVLLILTAHCLITFLLPIGEGCPTGYLGPGGLHNNALVSKNCTGGAAGYLDLKIFTLKHIYQWPTSKYIYQSLEYDPEGFLGTLTSIVQVWFGVQAGATMMVFPRPSSRLIRWGIWATVTGIAGGVLCGFKENEGWIPVNKNLWSLSFVLVTTSFAFILLSFLYIIIDIKKWWSGSPFFEPGMNSILLYVGHSVLSRAIPFHWQIKRMETHFVKLAETLWNTSLWVLIAIYLHAKKRFWSI